MSFRMDPRAKRPRIVPRDRSRSESFDRIVFVAAQLCGMPVAAFCVLDADGAWLKSAVGLRDEWEFAGLADFCRLGLVYGRTTVLEDASHDLRFAAHSLVTGPTWLRFYAGLGLSGADSVWLGVLAVVDHGARVLTERQCIGLDLLAREATALLAGSA